LPQVDQAGEAGKLSQGVGAAKASMPLALINGLNRGLAGATCGLGVSGMVKAVREYLWKQEWRFVQGIGGQSTETVLSGADGVAPEKNEKAWGPKNSDLLVCTRYYSYASKLWSGLQEYFLELADRICPELLTAGFQFFDEPDEVFQAQKKAFIDYFMEKHHPQNNPLVSDTNKAQKYFYLKSGEELKLGIAPESESSDSVQAYKFFVRWNGGLKTVDTDGKSRECRDRYDLFWSYKQVPMSGIELVKRLGVNGAMAVVGWKLLRWLGAHPIQARQAEVTPPPAAQKAESVPAKLTRVIRGDYVGGLLQAGAGASMVLVGSLALVKSVQALRSLEGMTTFSALATAQSAWTYGLPLGAILLARGVGTIYQMWG
jgi:hypothetical protein